MTPPIDQAINCLANFCGERSISSLTKEALQADYALTKVDVLVLFGGSIVSGVDLLAQAMQQNLARNYVIVGGYGHTSATLFEQAERLYPGSTQGKSTEADLFAGLLKAKYGLVPTFLETQSTNCGNNIAHLLALLLKEKIPIDSLLLIQDATMERRMALTLKKQLQQPAVIINFASYQVTVTQKNGVLTYQEPITGMWEMQRYISLLLGEIPRIRDDEQGYGPKGKNYLVHTDLPDEVEDAFLTLSREYPALIRQANEDFASPAN